MNNVHSVFTNNVPLPMCIIDCKGEILSVSSRIGEVFLYDSIEGANIFALTGIKYEKLATAARNDEQLIISRSEKRFKVAPAFLREDEGSMVLYFIDITEAENLRLKYEKEQPCFMLVEVDNYDELISSTEKDHQADLATAIDKEVRSWGALLKASVTRFRSQRFLLILEKSMLEMAERNKFDILDKVRSIETEADFPVTLSIGVGVGGETPEVSDAYSGDALDIAHGRGGDQAVVKHGNHLFYYGGKTQAVEKSNKGKSRIIGHALKRLIQTSSRVLIMGHRNPDMDAFGSAIGIYRLAKPLNKESYIIVDHHNEALNLIYDTAVETGDYEIINNHRALELVDDRTLVIIVDTHRPSITECPDLLEKVSRIAVIDHHRKAEESILNPTLSYTEPYASSASELVVEILQYTLEKKALTRFEAEALMAGISVDTNRFSVKTGVRTFEAAAWLKRNGADMAVVKKYFQVDREIFERRARGILAAEYEDNGMAYAICDGRNENAQIVNSQVADELLTVVGVRASFVAGMDENGRTVVSARSIGDLNVQVVMEKFGGGGHLNTAGAQMDISPQEAIEQVKKIMEKQNESDTVKGR
ncbi:MAG: DHH family phosphoesterase [Anaerovoracaceae bacterium]|jgi:c-di-AMP phosphodiesterase-like protein